MLADGKMIENPIDPSMTIYNQEKLDPNAYENPDYYYYYSDSEVARSEEVGETDEVLQEDLVGDADEEGGDSDEGDDNPRDDPDCWHGDIYVCDENGNCDSDNFDCKTDCADGSSVTTGELCPGNDDSDEPSDDGTDEDVEYCDGQAAPAYPDDCY